MFDVWQYNIPSQILPFLLVDVVKNNTELILT